MPTVQPKYFLYGKFYKVLLMCCVAGLSGYSNILKADTRFEAWSLSSGLSNTIYTLDRRTQNILLTVNPCSIGKGFWLKLVDNSNSLLTVESDANSGIALGLIRIDELGTSYVNFYVSKGSKDINLGGPVLEHLLFEMWEGSVLRLQANSRVASISNNLEQNPITLSFSLKGLRSAVEEAHKTCDEKYFQ